MKADGIIGDKIPTRWFWELPDPPRATGFIDAHTRSEARAELKVILNVKTLRGINFRLFNHDPLYAPTPTLP